MGSIDLHIALLQMVLELASNDCQAGTQKGTACTDGFIRLCRRCHVNACLLSYKMLSAV